MSTSASDNLRDEILRAALQLGCELGEDGLTMRGLSSRLGVSATAIYQHFESKAAILREIQVHGTKVLNAALHPAYEEPTATKGLRSLGKRYVAFAVENPWLYAVLNEQEPIDWVNLTSDEIATTLHSFHATVGLVMRGIESGELSVRNDPRVAAFQVWASLHGLASLILHRRLDEEHPTLPIANRDDLVDSFIDTIIRGLSA